MLIGWLVLTMLLCTQAAAAAGSAASTPAGGGGGSTALVPLPPDGRGGLAQALPGTVAVASGAAKGGRGRGRRSRPLSYAVGARVVLFLLFLFCRRACLCVVWSTRAVLAEIYLCHLCSCHEMLRGAGRRLDRRAGEGARGGGPRRGGGRGGGQPGVRTCHDRNRGGD
jgi:hypothetical protein